MAVSDPSTHEYDPFEAFDQSVGVGTIRDPYPRFDELLREAPVHPGTAATLFGLEDIEAELLYENRPLYSAISYNAVEQVLRDGATFSSSGYGESMGMVMGHSILEMDEPEHHRHRSLVAQAFTRKAMDRWEAELVRPIVNACIDEFSDRGSADLVRELTFPFPVRVIAGMLGLPEADLPQFHRWAVELISIAFDIDGGLAASASLRDYFCRIIEERRVEPANDVISVLAHAELDGLRLDD